MPRGRLYTQAEDALILRADRPRKAHIADAARAINRTPSAIRRRAQRLRLSGRAAADAESRDDGGAGEGEART